MLLVEFLHDMGGDPQAVSAEYLDLVKLSSNSHYEAMSFTESQTLNNEETTTGLSLLNCQTLRPMLNPDNIYLETDVLTSLVSYLFSPFVFILNMMDKWTEQRVKKILEKTSHIRRRYR